MDKELLVEAIEFVEKYKKENGDKSFLCERLRDGFIGNLITDMNGNRYIQSTRGKPYGTIVSIKTKDGVSIGATYLDSNDKDYPIIGCYLALKEAINNNTVLRNKAVKQIEHFKKRSLAFFWPEKYSYSRGTEPVKYEDYDVIHKRREMILGK